MADPARARRIADRIQELVAANLESTVKDPDLGFVTVTDVRVTGDLQHATVFYTVFGDDAQRETTAALIDRARGRLRSLVGRQLGIRLTPTLEFVADALPESSAQLEDALRAARQRDEELAAARAGAQYAGDADPYRHAEDEASAESTEGTGSDGDGARA